MKSSTCYFHMKTKILADFQICISVLLTVFFKRKSTIKRNIRGDRALYQRIKGAWRRRWNTKNNQPSKKKQVSVGILSLRTLTKLTQSARLTMLENKKELGNSHQVVSKQLCTKNRKKTAEQKRKHQQIHVGIKFQPSLTKWRMNLLGLANERIREVDQVKFAYADMHGNIKIMLRSPVQRKY